METCEAIRDVILPKPFLERFDPSLVPKPGTWPDIYVEGQDPEWQTVKGTLLLIDPLNDQAMAVWDSIHNLPFFFNKGFLRQNPNQKDGYKFVWNPNENTFADSENKGIFSNDKQLLYYNCFGTNFAFCNVF